MRTPSQWIAPWALPAIPSPSSRPRLRLGSSALTVTVKRWGWPPNVWEREGLADRFIPVHAAFDQLDQVLADQDIERVDAVFMDLGLSSLQIDETDRGFSYSHDAPLDMRMDVSQPLTAERILATYDAAELVRIFKEYGEERFSRQIARAIVARRDKEPFTTTAQLNRLVDEVVPQAHRPAGNSRQTRLPGVAH